MSSVSSLVLFTVSYNSDNLLLLITDEEIKLKSLWLCVSVVAVCVCVPREAVRAFPGLGFSALKMVLWGATLTLNVEVAGSNPCVDQRYNTGVTVCD